MTYGSPWPNGGQPQATSINVGQLGQLYRTYRPGSAGGVNVFWGVVMLAFGVIVAFGLGSASGGNLVVALFVVLIFFGAAAYYFYDVAKKAPPSKVDLYQGGFAVERSGQTRVIRWVDVAKTFDQITNVHRNSRSGPIIEVKHTFTVTLRSGEQLVFYETLKDVADMIALMQRLRQLDRS